LAARPSGVRYTSGIPGAAGLSENIMWLVLAVDAMTTSVGTLTNLASANQVSVVAFPQ